MKAMNMKECLSYYNANCAAADLGPVKRFATLAKAQERCAKLYALLNPQAQEQKAQSISDGVRKSWEDEGVRAARSVRTEVRVDGVDYRSVRAAYVALGLDLKGHIEFRMLLKRTGKVVSDGRVWEVLK